jgi:hypothetical protein
MKRLLAIAFAACASNPPPPPAPPATGPVAAEPDKPGAPSPIVDQGTIRSRFRDCGNEMVGQVIESPGARCIDVCTTFGYSRCRGRAEQAGFETCKGETPIVGTCDEAFPSGGSQCDCTNKPKP